MDQQELSQQQIDKLIEFKMKRIEQEYLECRKYDIKDNNPIELRGTFEQDEFNYAQYDKLDWQQQDQNQQEKEKKDQQNIKNNEDTQQKDQDSEVDSDDENQEIPQGYEQIDSDGDQDQDNENLPEVKTSEIDFQSQEPSEDPRKKELDLEKIRFYMNQIKLEEPEWAKDPKQFASKLQQISKQDKKQKQ